MPPYIKLAIVFTKLAKQHGTKLIHGGDLDLLTKDLGDALRRQKKVILDADLGAFETAYEALPVIAEVKILTMAVCKKLSVETKGKSASVILAEIVEKTEARGSQSAAEIKNTLAWAGDFFDQPEIKEILQADLIEVKKPTGWTDFKGMGKSVQQSAQRISQEFTRLSKFLEKAKKVQDQKNQPKNDGPKN
jgi:hypothetical protein